MIIERKKQFIKNNDLLLITHLTQGEPNVQMRFAPIVIEKWQWA